MARGEGGQRESDVSDSRAGAVDRLLRLAHQHGLPVTVGTSYGSPALKVRDKTFVIVRNADELSLMMALEQKELLIEAAPAIYYETDHYKGWPAVIVRLSAIPDEELGQRLKEAWRRKAPKRLVAQVFHDEATPRAARAAGDR